MADDLVKRLRALSNEAAGALEAQAREIKKNDGLCQTYGVKWSRRRALLFLVIVSTVAWILIVYAAIVL